MTTTPAWRRLTDHVMAIPERVYETWTSAVGWNNVTQFGAEYGENGVSWCVIWDWDMFHDVQLDGIVPRTDNVSNFTDWAQKRGQWSEYPSVGSWVNFGNGAHTEIVVGFDATYVYTKGGNSIEAGASDNGQGNGVWSHQHRRTDPYVVGYFAPRWPDGVCPPTADPNDPRGGKPVTSWRWSPPAPAAKPVVSLAHVVYAAEHDPAAAQGHVSYRADVLLVERALQAEGLLAAQWVDGSFGTKTVSAYAALQRRYGYTGSDADGIPGHASLTRLGDKHGFTVVA
ncbi:MAG TPA: peptidoglycan-binding domain-containing protein [Nocardioides sp.]|nr:peptidoglycan-binding domain-containing protein [Nocardioides sp.]